MTAQVLVVGWDGADRSVVQSLVEAGRLPALATLIDRGNYQPVSGYPGLGDDAHWCSFSTGLPPGEHGRFHYMQYHDGSYAERYITRAATRQPPFWASLDPAAGPFAVIDVPKSPLAVDVPRHGGARPVNDIQVVDWMTHGEESPTGVVLPHDHHLADLFTADPTFACHRTIATPTALATHVADIHERGQRRAATTIRLLGDERWGLFLTVAAEPHCAGHHCWHLHDADHEARGLIPEPTIGDPLVRSLEDADRSLGELVEAAGRGAAILVFSPTGMGPDTFGHDVANEVLQRYEATLGARIRLAALGHRLRPTRPGRRSPRAGQLAWAGSNDGVSTPIRLNLVGREALGLVTPGEHQDRVVADLCSLFGRLIDAQSGMPLVRDIVDVHERYPGACNDCFADLLVQWNSTRPVTAVRSPELGTFSLDARPKRSGNHRDGGWLVRAGGVRPLAPTTGDLAPHDLAELITAEVAARS